MGVREKRSFCYGEQGAICVTSNRGSQEQDISTLKASLLLVVSEQGVLLKGE